MQTLFKPLSAQKFAQIFDGYAIHPLAQSDFARARKHLDALTKPVGSLGRIEDLAARLYAIAHGKTPLTVSPGLIYTVAGDHGVAAQGVSPFPKAVTRQMLENFLAEGAGINALCESSGLSLRVIDAGCAGGAFAPHPKLLSFRQGDGTDDLSLGHAMSRESCLNCLRAGFALGGEAKREGIGSLGLGEMGIANSTSATALYCAYFDLEPKAVTGPGAGAGAAMLAHKKAIVAKALVANARAIASGDPVEILAALGGFEIATIAGLVLGSAANNLPVLIDGFIATAAFAAACAIAPAAFQYAFLSHCSAEPGYSLALEKILASFPLPPLAGSAAPLLNLNLRLGEGTGCALAWPLLNGACAVYNQMASLEAAGVTATEADRLG